MALLESSIIPKENSLSFLKNYWRQYYLEVCSNDSDLSEKIRGNVPVFRYTWLSCFCRLSEPPYNTHTTHSSCICSDKGLTLEMSAWNSLRWPIYVINSVDGILLPCYTLPPTQHHSFFRNLSPFFISQKYTCCCTPESHKHSRFDHK